MGCLHTCEIFMHCLFVISHISEVESQAEITFLEGMQQMIYLSESVDNNEIQETFKQLPRDSFLSSLVSRGPKISRNGSVESESGINYNVSSQCMTDFEIVLTSIGNEDPYALQMVDAAGKPASNIFSGNLLWPGSYSECISIQPRIQVNQTWTKPFSTQYCSAGIGKINTTVPAAPGGLAVAPGVIGLILGICAPDSCSSEDVRALVNSAIGYLPINFDASTVQCQINIEDRQFDSSAVGIICLLSVLFALILFGSVYDLFDSYRSLSRELSLPEVACSRARAEVDGRREVLEPDSSENAPLLIKPPTSVQQPKPNICTVLQSFSIFTNGSKLLTVGPSSESNLGCVHGIRFLSMSWVILGHTIVFGIFFTANPIVLLSWAKGFAFQAILNASVSVDSFFVLSGILASYLLLREMKKKDGPRNIPWWKFYFHRFWRLTPPYMLVLGTYVSLFYYIGEGPFWPKNIDGYCRKNWWTNILYINNLMDVNTGCFGWSWYLANDMQFFLITPLLVVPFHSSRKIFRIFGWIVNFSLVLVSMITSGVITRQHNYPAEFPALISNMNNSMDSLNFMTDIYTSPWCRVGPYAIGILFGYLLYKSDRKFECHKIWIWLGWFIAASSTMAVLYGLYKVPNGYPLSPDVSAFYAAVHRNVWALGLGWVIFACCTGNGGPVNTLLSWSGFVPLSRLTFMAYLIHPIVMYYCYFSSESPIFFTTVNVVYLFLAHITIAYGISFVLSLTFEAPMIALEKVILPR